MDRRIDGHRIAGGVVTGPAGLPEIDGTEAKEVTLNAGKTTLQFKGQEYLLGFVLPNFFFHVTTAYDILRVAGTPIGKKDYLGI